jgi:hypothetical protein
LLTTYRTIFFISDSGVEVPHFYVKSADKWVSLKKSNKINREDYFKKMEL